MDGISTSDFDQKFRLEDPFDLIADLIIERLRNDALQDALLHQTEPREPEKIAPAPPEPKPPESYDLAGAAKYLGMTPRKLRELFKARRVAGSRIDYRHYLFTRADLNEFLAAYRSKPKRI